MHFPKKYDTIQLLYIYFDDFVIRKKFVCDKNGFSLKQGEMNMKFKTFFWIAVSIGLIAVGSIMEDRVDELKQGGYGEPENIVEELTDDAIEYMYEKETGYDRYIETIKSMNIPGYSITFGEAFSGFFSNPKWEHFTSEKGNEIIQFTGGCTYSGRNVEVLIAFTVTDEYGDYIEAEISHLTIDGSSQNDVVISMLLGAIAEDYL